MAIFHSKKEKSISDAMAGLFESSFCNQGLQANIKGGAAELAGSRRVPLSAARSMLGKCFTFSRLHEIDATVS
jgi:hypothetical protein